jgi:hypothetical protein
LKERRNLSPAFLEWRRAKFFIEVRSEKSALRVGKAEGGISFSDKRLLDALATSNVWCEGEGVEIKNEGSIVESATVGGASKLLQNSSLEQAELLPEAFSVRESSFPTPFPSLYGCTAKCIIHGVVCDDPHVSQSNWHSHGWILTWQKCRWVG